MKYVWQSQSLVDPADLDVVWVFIGISEWGSVAHLCGGGGGGAAAGSEQGGEKVDITSSLDPSTALASHKTPR